MISDTLCTGWQEVGEMPRDWRRTGGNAWRNLTPVPPETYRCGYCASDVASDKGLITEPPEPEAYVRVCPQCNGPTLFAVDGTQWPGPKLGANVAELPGDIASIHEESRNSLAVNAFTGSVMLCRKILMHIAVEKGAKDNLSFREYVEWLIKERYAPKGAEVWLDYIRNRGNEANHEIVVMTKEDAIGVLHFTEALLRAVYELPTMVPSLPGQEESIT